MVGFRAPALTTGLGSLGAPRWLGPLCMGGIGGFLGYLSAWPRGASLALGSEHMLTFDAKSDVAVSDFLVARDNVEVEP